MNPPIEWLLEGEPWVVYRTQVDLLGRPESDPAVVLSRQAMVADGQVQRLLAMLDILKSKTDERGRFTLESIWTAWKDWEFGQKRAPSRWLTVLAWRIIRRVEAVQ